MGISINGLSSGLDTAQMIKDLMAVERLPYTNLETKKTALQTEQGVFRTINTKFKSLEAALNALKNPGDFSQLKATSTGTSASATAKAGASAGSYNINVDKLATANVVRISGTDILKKIGTDLQIGGYTLLQSDVDAITAVTSPEDKLKKLAEIINRESAATGTTSSGTKATVMQATSGQLELMLTSTKTGEVNSVKLTSGGTSIVPAEGLFNIKGEDAQFTLNGISITRASNEIDDLISDVTFKLTGKGESTVAIAADTDALVNNIKTFVTAYNDLISLVKDNLSKPSDENVTNPLQGNSLLKQINNDLYSMFNEGVITVPGATGFSTFMEDLGLSIDKGAKSGSEMTGKITFDESAFKSAFAADPNKVISVLTNSADVEAENKNGETVFNPGIFTKLSGIMSRYTSTVNGMLTSKITGYDSEIKIADERMENMNLKLEMKEARLKQQFSNMEVMLSSLKNEQNWLTSQFQSLLKSNS